MEIMGINTTENIPQNYFNKAWTLKKKKGLLFLGKNKDVAVLIQCHLRSREKVCKPRVPNIRNVG